MSFATTDNSASSPTEILTDALTRADRFAIVYGGGLTLGVVLVAAIVALAVLVVLSPLIVVGLVLRSILVSA